jgi:WD40 repeat protein
MHCDEHFEDLLTRLDELAEANPAASVSDLANRDEVLVGEIRRHPEVLGQLAEGLASLRATDRWLGLDRLAEPVPQIPGFVDLEETGRGGMGIVYRARQVSLNRTVAIKLMLAGRLGGARLRERFRVEVETVARLRHPNIVEIYETGDADGVPYCVYEYLAGKSLADTCAGQPLGERVAAETVQTLAHAVEYAHAQGVVHRDLKPANVLVSESGLLKIGDFGLAKDLRQESDLTLAGELPGSPSYMAPEQLKGADVGPAVDVYALGAILYELLTGRPPFLGETSAETLVQVSTQEPLAPSRRREKLSRDLEAICLKCLSKEPPERYATAGELAADLRRYLAGQPTLARPANLAGRATKWVRRRPLVAGLLAVAVLLAATLAVGGFWYTSRLDQQRALLIERQYARDMRAAFRAREVGAPEQAEALLARYDPGTGNAALRGFEWFWLEHALHEESLVIETGHGEAYAVVFSPDGQWLLSGGQDGAIRAWDRSSGTLAFELLGHTSCVNWLAFSPDGRRLASASCDQSVRLWDIFASREGQVIAELPHRVNCLSFARGQDWLAAGLDHGRVLVWNTSSGERVADLVGGGPETAINSLAFRGNDAMLVAASQSSESATWSTQSWSQIAITPRAFALASFENDESVLLGNREHEVYLWNPTRPDVTRVIGRLPSEVQCLAASRRGDWVLAAGLDGSVRTFSTGRRVHRMFSVDTRVGGLAISPDGQQLAAASYDGNVRVWNLSAMGRSLSPDAPEPPIFANVSPDGNWLVVVCPFYTARVWDARTGELLREGAVPYREFTSSASGRLCLNKVAGRGDGNLRRLPSLDMVPHFPSMRGVAAVSISGDDRSVASVTESGELCVYDIASGHERYCARLPSDVDLTAVQIALSDDGSCLLWAVAGKWGDYGIDTSTGESVAAPTDLAKFVPAFTMGCFSFSPDGRLSIIPDGDGGTFVVRDALTGAVLHRLTHRSELTYECAWSPDGSRLAIATEDQSVVMYDTRSGEEVGELDGGLEPIISNLVFSADGQTLTAFTGGVEGSPGRVHRWRAARE